MASSSNWLKHIARRKKEQSESSSSDDSYSILYRSSDMLMMAAIQQQEREGNFRDVMDQSRVKGGRRLWNDYFALNSLYGEDKFRRRFRMRQELFDRIFIDVSQHDSYFVQKNDAAGAPGFTSHQKLTADMRMLAYGCAADSLDEYLRMAESTTLEVVRHFTKAIVEIYSTEYCRNPTADDIKKINEENTARGFPGILGSVDCMHWEWKNCPTAHAGQYTGRKGKPTIILEAVASYDLWFWHAFFGMSGANNDINVLQRSYIFDELLDGRAPAIDFVINKIRYDTGYYLADGIYSELTTIVKTFQQPVGEKQKLFSKFQEGVRKDIERAFGVLQARFAIIKNPGKSWNSVELAYVMKACIILHNIIVEDERRPGDWHTDYDQDSNNEPLRYRRVDIRQRLQQRATKYTQINNDKDHHELRNNLMEHIYQRRERLVRKNPTLVE